MLPTMMDIAIASKNDALIPLIDETSKAHPEITDIMAKPMKGRSYKTRIRTALGRVTGSFRNANEGSTPIKHTYENHQVESYILNPQFQIDAAVAGSHEDGPEAYIATEREGILEGEFQGMASQFYYGTAFNAKGYPGLVDAYDHANMSVDATGSTANSATSCWLIRTGLDGVLWRFGENGKMELTQPTPFVMTDPNDSTKTLPGLYSYLLAYPGLQVASIQAACRIFNLTAQSGKGLTDALIAKAISKFPSGKGPNLILCNRTATYQLQTSRTVVINGGGSGNPDGGSANIAPIPTSAQGITLKSTDAITDTEAII